MALTTPLEAPKTAKQLFDRAENIAGLTLGELAVAANIVIPANFQRHKGWSGQLLEIWLGATAGSKPQQDFPQLGIELKSLPINRFGVPLETTYVCYAPLISPPGLTWELSNVRNKLSKVLWIPVEGERSIPISERKVGSPIMWSPDESEERILSTDWEELMCMIQLGKVESITSKYGEALHLRPKAADGNALTDALNENGQRMKTRPRGFYLRKSFTEQIIAKQFGF